MIPLETIVEIWQADPLNHWDIATRNFRKGQKNLYKIVGKRITWPGDPQRYTCIMVHPNGKRRGSWDYSLREPCIRPVVRKDVNLEDYM